MPYISKLDRVPYIPLIENTVAIICEEKDPLMRAEYLGFFLKCILDLGNHCDSDGSHHLVCVFFDVEKTKLLSENADKMSKVIYSHPDIFDQAGNMNYCMSAVIWGVLGDSLHATSARYGFRAYVKSILWSIYHEMTGYQPDPTWLRTRGIMRGVITDVIDEMYRRKTALYEDQKIKECGDVWPLRDISWKEEAPILVNREIERFDEL